MDPEERIRRREERRRRRETDKLITEQETSANNIRSGQRDDLSTRTSDYRQMTTSLEPEKSTEEESEPIYAKDEHSKWNGDENHNDLKEEQREECRSMNGPDSGAEQASEENVEEPTEHDVDVAATPKAIPAAKPSENEPEALNIYKEMKMKKEQDESVNDALVKLRMEQNQRQEELEVLRKRKAERARQWEEADRVQQQHAEDRRKRQQEGEQKLKEEFERQKKEREMRMKKMAHNPYAYQAPIVSDGKAPLKFGIRKAEARERVKKNTLSERVPPLNLDPVPSKDVLRQLAEDLVEKLKTAYGKFFDLEYQTERSKYTIHELKTRIKAMNKYSYERQAKASVGGLSNIVKQLEQAQSTVGSPKSRIEREKQAGSILSSGGVKARLAMFGGGSANQSNDETEKRQIDLTK